ncbi:MAG: hypothetical protein U5O69_10545 [Candidatus Competibacteraceae bacterium]|nr:hypothetical protein [Candidatus Competibacteraceae bacterium]
MKIRHILLALLVLLTIAFMQPLITFLGGLTLLLTVGILIFRDLSPAIQDAVEQRMLGWLRQARADSWPESKASAVVRERFPTTSVGVPAIPERTRRSRTKTTAPGAPDSANDNSAPPPA